MITSTLTCVGLRIHYFSHLAHEPSQVDGFEIISENYFAEGGRPYDMLEHLRENHPVIMHGVSLGIGSTAPVSMTYLKMLKNLAERIEPILISDHVCWGMHGHYYAHDLLPVPYTPECLEHMIERTQLVQDTLKRQILLENPSSYIAFKSSSMFEWEFISELSKRSGCGLLLDINNIYVSSVNHDFDPKRYIDAIVPSSVQQYHLAGHTHLGTHILDTHDAAVCDDVWHLYDYALERIGPRLTVIERDDHYPDYSVLVAEAHEAQARMIKAARGAA